MIKQHLALYPFATTADFSLVTTTVDILRCSNILIINYEVQGNLAGILIPGVSKKPYRKNKLWEQTCFELFLSVRNSSSYWEFNFSPGGHWNVYSFKAYREGMIEEVAFTELTSRVHFTEAHILSCSVEIDLNRIVQPDSRLDAAVTAVIKLKDGTLTYWAPTHRIGGPDFHRRDGFIAVL